MVYSAFVGTKPFRFPFEAKPFMAILTLGSSLVRYKFHNIIVMVESLTRQQLALQIALQRR